MEYVSVLKDIEQGNDIYIIGSGKSMDFYPKDFFKDRVTIGVNHVFDNFDVKYVVSHHHPQCCQRAIDAGKILITSEHDTCIMEMAKHNLVGDYYVYKHRKQGFMTTDFSAIGIPDHLIAAGTPVVTAISLAHLMGANNVFLCGVDMGMIDGIINYKGYTGQTAGGHPQRSMTLIREAAVKFRQLGLGVLSIIPFTDIKLEGHTYA